MRKWLTVLLAVALCGVSLAGCDKQEEPQDMVKTVTVNGREMKYLRFGKEDGEKFVILPGLALKSVMGSAEGIMTAYGLLAENYDVYLFDHVSEEPDGYQVSDMAADTVKAFETLGLDHVHLMGVSMGGMVAQTIAVNHPELTDSLILCSTTSDASKGNQEVFGQWKVIAEKKDTGALMELFGLYVYTPAFFNAYRDIIIASGQGATDLDYRNFLTSLAAVRDFNITDQLDKITCPVLVLGAGEDQVVGVQASYDIIEKLNCKYFIYEGFGHGVYDEAPDYLSHIDGFLKEMK